MFLYDTYESARRWLAPSTYAAQAWFQAWTHPDSVWSSLPGASLWSAGPELFFRLAKDYPKPAFGIHEIQKDGHRVAVMEQEVDKTAFCSLVRFKRFSDEPAVLDAMKKEPIVLVVAPLSGHYATLLRDTVRTLLQDHRVYITDWKNARDVPASEGEFSLDDYVATLNRFADKLGADSIHVIGVCQPVVPVLGMVSLRASQGLPAPKSMVLMGGPVDSRQSPTAVNNLATRQSYEWFENNVIHRVPAGFQGQGRRVYPGFLQHMGFVAMNPERHSKAHWEFFEDLLKGDRDDAQSHRDFYDEYNAVLDMPADYYLDTIRVVFQEHRLPQGTWKVKGRLVKPADVRKTALLTIEGERDDIAGQGQTFAAHALCSSLPKAKKKHLLAKGAGHYGLFSGRRWREEIYPVMRDFIASQDTR